MRECLESFEDYAVDDDVYCGLEDLQSMVVSGMVRS